MTPVRMGSFAKYAIEIRDSREIERRLTAFDTADFPSTTCVFPSGTSITYGDARFADFPVVLQFAQGGRDGPLLLDTRSNRTGPIRYVNLIEHWNNLPPIGANAPVQFAITADMAKVFTPVTTWSAPSFFAHTWPNILIQWRITPSDPWTSITHLQVHTVTPDFDIVHRSGADVDYVDVNGETKQAQAVPCIRRVYFGSLVNSELPPITTPRIYVRILYRGPATEYWPFHYEGPAGVFKQNLYDGVYSRRDVNGNLRPTGIRYNPDALAAMTDPLLARIVEPIDDIRAFTETDIAKPLGYVDRMDRDLRISPTSIHLPDSQARASLTVIDDAITVPEPAQWSGGDRFVNIVRMKYQRLWSLISGPDPFSPGHSGDAIRTFDVTHEFRAQESVDANGEEEWSSEPSTLHSIGFGVTQSSVMSVDDEIGFLAVEKAASVLLPRYAWGAPVIGVPVFRCETRLLQAGDFVITRLSWIPDYFKLRRGLENYGMVIAIRDLDCSLRFAMIEIAETPTIASGGSISGGGAVSGGTITVVPSSGVVQGGGAISGGTIIDDQIAGGTIAAGGAITSGVFVSNLAGGEVQGGGAVSGGEFGDFIPPEVGFLPGYFPYGFGLYGE
jgi:hypothetical protein